METARSIDHLCLRCGNSQASWSFVPEMWQQPGLLFIITWDVATTRPLVHYCQRCGNSQASLLFVPEMWQQPGLLFISAWDVATARPVFCSLLPEMWQQPGLMLSFIIILLIGFHLRGIWTSCSKKIICYILTVSRDFSSINPSGTPDSYNFILFYLVNLLRNRRETAKRSSLGAHCSSNKQRNSCKKGAARSSSYNSSWQKGNLYCNTL